MMYTFYLIADGGENQEISIQKVLLVIFLKHDI